MMHPGSPPKRKPQPAGVPSHFPHLKGQQKTAQEHTQKRIILLLKTCQKVKNNNLLFSTRAVRFSNLLFFKNGDLLFLKNNNLLYSTPIFIIFDYSSRI